MSSISMADVSDDLYIYLDDDTTYTLSSDLTIDDVSFSGFAFNGNGSGITMIGDGYAITSNNKPYLFELNIDLNRMIVYTTASIAGFSWYGPDASGTISNSHIHAPDNNYNVSDFKGFIDSNNLSKFKAAAANSLGGIQLTDVNLDLSGNGTLFLIDTYVDISAANVNLFIPVYSFSNIGTTQFNVDGSMPGDVVFIQGTGEYINLIDSSTDHTDPTYVIFDNNSASFTNGTFIVVGTKIWKVVFQGQGGGIGIQLLYDIDDNITVDVSTNSVDSTISVNMTVTDSSSGSFVVGALTSVSYEGVDYDSTTDITGFSTSTFSVNTDLSYNVLVNGVLIDTVSIIIPDYLTFDICGGAVAPPNSQVPIVVTYHSLSGDVSGRSVQIIFNDVSSAGITDSTGSTTILVNVGLVGGNFTVSTTDGSLETSGSLSISVDTLTASLSDVSGNSINQYTPFNFGDTAYIFVALEDSNGLDISGQQIDISYNNAHYTSMTNSSGKAIVPIQLTYIADPKAYVYAYGRNAVYAEVPFTINPSLLVVDLSGNSPHTFTSGDTIRVLATLTWGGIDISGEVVTATYNGTDISGITGVDGTVTFDFSAALLASSIGVYTPLYDGNNTVFVSFTVVSDTEPICFLSTAPVLTPSGYVKISKLAVGDEVLTSDGRTVKIQRVRCDETQAGPSTNPYIIQKGQFGATKRLLISPSHRVQTPKGLIEARNLGLKQEEMSGSFDYYNLELPDWERDNMVVAGVTVESLAPIRRITVSKEEFSAMIRKKYGKITPEVLATLKRTCRKLADGRVDVPVMRK